MDYLKVLGISYPARAICRIHRDAAGHVERTYGPEHRSVFADVCDTVIARPEDILLVAAALGDPARVVGAIDGHRGGPEEPGRLAEHCPVGREVYGLVTDRGPAGAVAWVRGDARDDAPRAAPDLDEILAKGLAGGKEQ
jgi:hypothetical protein